MAIKKLIICFLLLGFNLLVKSQYLDNSFGNMGLSITNMGTSGYAYSVALQSDNKIVAFGCYSSYCYFLSGARYDTNGNINSFGNGYCGLNTCVHSIAIQPDDKIVIAGSNFEGYPTPFFHDTLYLIKYNSNGQLDNTFGKNGVVKERLNFFSSYEDKVFSVVLQNDGKIIVGGFTDGIYYDFYLERYKNNGIIDSTFGNNGKVYTDIDSTDDKCRAIALQNDNKIIAVGNSINKFAIVRYNNNGTIDTTFGDKGKVVNINGVAKSVSIQTDGKIVVGGKILTAPFYYCFGLVRFNLDGTIDTTFGNKGKAITDISGSGNDYGESLAIQPDGKIILSGYVINSSTNKDFALVRYNADGSLDTTFGNNGIITTDFGSNIDDMAFSMVLQPDNKIVLAGLTKVNGYPYSLALARYNSLPLKINDVNKKDDVAIHSNEKNIYININKKQATSAFVEVFDITGKKVLNEKFSENSKKYTVNKSDGIYFIRLLIDENVYTKKVSLISQ